MIAPPWTSAMQSLWNRAMFLERTRGAYGVGFPQPGANYKPPTPGTMLHSILFCATATQAEYDEHLQAVRADMEQWKARVAASRGVVRRSDIAGIDLSKMRIDL